MFLAQTEHVLYVRKQLMRYFPQTRCRLRIQCFYSPAETFPHQEKAKVEKCLPGLVIVYFSKSILPFKNKRPPANTFEWL